MQNESERNLMRFLFKYGKIKRSTHKVRELFIL